MSTEVIASLATTFLYFYTIIIWPGIHITESSYYLESFCRIDAVKALSMGISWRLHTVKIIKEYGRDEIVEAREGGMEQGMKYEKEMD